MFGSYLDPLADKVRGHGVPLNRAALLLVQYSLALHVHADDGSWLARCRRPLL